MWSMLRKHLQSWDDCGWTHLLIVCFSLVECRPSVLGRHSTKSIDSRSGLSAIAMGLTHSSTIAQSVLCPLCHAWQGR